MMKKKFQTSLFIFRRDLRLEDNTGLIFALQSSETVIPAFIFTPEQLEKNPYRSDHCVKFMIESLQDLQEQLKEKGGKLYFFKGHPDEIVKKCITKLKVEAVVVNRDYTPYSIKRDQQLEKLCKALHSSFHSFDDALLHPPEETVKNDGQPYARFTPYFFSASKQTVAQPTRNRLTNYFTGSIEFAENKSILPHLLPKQKISNSVAGGSSQDFKKA
jgi:deoxyribodipyrimidine photo-lyase